MKKIFIFGTGFIFSIFAVFTAACNNTVNSRTGENSNAAAVKADSARNDSDTTTSVEQLFKVDFKSEPGVINAGTPATLSFTVKDKQGATVKDLPIVHEKPMHLLIVSKDLAEFYHIHPEPQADGTYRVSHVFPNGGDYRLYADFTPRDSKQVVEKIDVKVAGTKRAEVALQPDTKLEKSVDGLRVVLKPQGEIKAANELMLEFAAFDAKTNQPATDLENYLGELAHFVIISEDMQDFVHAHPMSKDEHDSMKKSDAKKDDHSADGHTHGAKKSGAKTQSASEVAAHTAFPRSGKYKIWAQFQRGGKIITVPFVVNVKADDQKAEIKTANVPADAVKVTVSKNGYEPSEIKLQKGKPAKLAFYRADAENCGGEVVFTKLNIKKKLPVGETVLIEFTPTETGDVAFTCGMGMLKGSLVVAD